MQSKSTLSSSNPQLNASSQSDGQSMQSSGWDNEKTKGGTDGSNTAGNRNSMAETRVGAINVPGLSTGSNKKVKKTIVKERFPLVLLGRPV
jgi:peroxiredoxin